MRVWTCNDFKGMWPVGSAAVVVAKDEEQARRILDWDLRQRGLDGLRDSDRIIEIDTDTPDVRVLNDGDY